MTALRFGQQVIVTRSPGAVPYSARYAGATDFPGFVYVNDGCVDRGLHVVRAGSVEPQLRRLGDRWAARHAGERL